MSLYNCRGVGQNLRIVKFDNLLNVEAVYDMPVFNGRIGCSCFAASKPMCRHRDMAARFVEASRVNTGHFWDYDAQEWLPPLTTEQDQ